MKISNRMKISINNDQEFDKTINKYCNDLYAAYSWKNLMILHRQSGKIE